MLKYFKINIKCPIIRRKGLNKGKVKLRVSVLVSIKVWVKEVYW